MRSWVKKSMTQLRTHCPLGRQLVVLVLAATTLMAAAAESASAGTRVRVDWAPSDPVGWPSLHPPYIFVDTADGSRAGQYQGVCSGASNCGSAPGTRWVEENPDSGGNPRTISFVDDSATQYSTYRIEASHFFSGVGPPDIVGTATITHADGRSYSVPFTLQPKSTPDPSVGNTFLGVSEGLPRPDPEPGQGPGPHAVLGQSVVVKVKGKLVRIRRPGSSKFEELKGTSEVPVGSVLDTRKGKVKLSSAKDAAGHVQTAHFAGGVFKVLQKATDPLTTLKLVGKLEGCAGQARTAAAAVQTKGRRLWGSGKGSFRTRGRRSAATVTGTRWLVADLCDRSTLTRVKSGVVEVRDFGKGRTVVLEAGEQYLAKP